MPEKFKPNAERELRREITIRTLTPIQVGVEGPKYIAEVEDPTSKDPYTMFVKSMYERKDALQQQRQWQDLKELGINVPERAWAHEFNNGVQTLVATDLSGNGRRLVLSCNNPELKTPEGRGVIKTIPTETKQMIKDHLLFSAIAVSGLGPTQIARRYSLSNDTFALVIDPQHPETAKPVAIDYGVDLHEPRPNEAQQDLLRSSLFGAGCFYAIVVGEELELPDDPIFASVDRAALKKYCQETVEFFWHENEKK